MTDFSLDGGTSIVILNTMKLLIISIDPILIEVVEKAASKYNFKLLSFMESREPLDILSTVCSSGPNVILFDDDFLESKTIVTLKAIKKVNKKVAIVFLTSNNSIELGRAISNIGVQYYGLKPIDNEEFNDLLESIPNLVNKHIN